MSDDKDGTQSELDSNQWDGIIGDLKTGAAHMGIGPITVTKARMAAVDFSSPFYYSKFSFLVATTKAKASGQKNWKAFVLWMTKFCTYLG